VVVTDGLTIAPKGLLDVGTNAAIVNYSGSSIIGVIRALLQIGYHSGDWTGGGISSSAAESDPTHSQAVGYGEASALAPGGTFLGQTVDGTAILIRHTLYGDANLDHKVDTLDFNALAANFGGSGKHWYQADFNYSAGGVVDTLDFNLLAANFGRSLPEPMVGVLAAAAPAASPAASSLFSADPVQADTLDLPTDANGAGLI
jgi:hypothetical protein